MSELKTKEQLTGKLNAQTITATGTVPEWLQPLIKENGVYVGTTEPTDPTKLVWINPDGEPSPSGGTVDLSDYYTKDETDTQIEQAVQGIDFTPYATRVELEQYDTSAEVDKKIEAIEIPETDLTGYAKETWVTEQLKPYAKKSEIPDVSGYALKTEIPSLDGYATESYVDEKLADVEVEVPVATVDTLGIVKPDGVTIIIKDGVLTAVGGGGGGVVWESPTQIKNDLRLFQGLTVLQNNNSLEVY